MHDTSLEGYCHDLAKSRCLEGSYHACCIARARYSPPRSKLDPRRGAWVDRIPLGAGIGALRKKREEMVKKLKKEETEKKKMEEESSVLVQRVTELEESLERRRNAVQGCDEAIRLAERTFQSILESSHDLLSNVKKENEKMESLEG